MLPSVLAKNFKKETLIPINIPLLTNPCQQSLLLFISADPWLPETFSTPFVNLYLLRQS